MFARSNRILEKLPKPDFVLISDFKGCINVQQLAAGELLWKKYNCFLKNKDNITAAQMISVPDAKNEGKTFYINKLQIQEYF